MTQNQREVQKYFIESVANNIKDKHLKEATYLNEFEPISTTALGIAAIKWICIAVVGALAVKGCTDNTAKGIDAVKATVDNPEPTLIGMIAGIIKGLSKGLDEGVGIDIPAIVNWVKENPTYASLIAGAIGISTYALIKYIPKLFKKAEELFLRNKKIKELPPQAEKNIDVAVDAIKNGNMNPKDVLKMKPETFSKGVVTLESLLESLK